MLRSKYILFACYGIIFLSIGSLPSFAQKEIKVYDEFESFENDWLKWNSDTVLVVNFWATWCKPCVKELPFFEDLHKAGKNFPVKVVLVSIDRKADLETRLIPFLKNKEMTADVKLLTAGSAHIWIDKVHSDWSGSIPATLLLKKNKRGFYEKEFENYDELLNLVKEF